MPRFGDIAGPIGEGLSGLAEVGAGSLAGMIAGEELNQKIRAEQQRLQIERAWQEIERQRQDKEEAWRKATAQAKTQPSEAELVAQRKAIWFGQGNTEKTPGYQEYVFGVKASEPKPLLLEEEVQKRSALGRSMGLTGMALKEYALTGKLPMPKEPKPPTAIETIKETIAAVNEARKRAGKPPLTPEEETTYWPQPRTGEDAAIRENIRLAMVPSDPNNEYSPKVFNQQVFDSLMSNYRRQKAPVAPAAVGMGDVKTAEPRNTPPPPPHPPAKTRTGYKPNHRYRIGGKVVHTDSQGEIVQ